jgi:hypothetical protein
MHFRSYFVRLETVLLFSPFLLFICFTYFIFVPLIFLSGVSSCNIFSY